VLVRAGATEAIVGALVANRKGPLTLRTKAIPSAVGRRTFGPVIVIRRGSNRLFLYNGTRFLRSFGVATGQSIYPTPLGRFRIVVKWRDPWWYPPDSDWARGQSPIPPGPGNPLGTRWMGLSAAGVGIHGTPDAASIGYSVSHGCIRMRIPDAEWLFLHVHIGTTVFIVGA
jgi:lipoprotein-anchoring transpeptidase ErfK/SrfK